MSNHPRQHVIDTLKGILFFPLSFVHHVINFLLQDFADSFSYTRKDVFERPYLFSTLGWIFLYLLFCMCMPFLTIFINFQFDLNFLTVSFLLGTLLWIAVFMIGVDILGGRLIRFVKRLTAKILKYVKRKLHLHSEPVVNEFNKSAKICRL